MSSNLYRYSFKPHTWSRTHARQPELQAYLEGTVDDFGLRPHLRLGVTVKSATWDDDRHVWTLMLRDGGRRRVPRDHQRRRLPERAPLSRMARVGGLPGRRFPHLPMGSSLRLARQGRGRCRDRIDCRPGRSRHSAHGGEALSVSAGAGLGHAQRGARPDPGGTGDPGPAVVPGSGPSTVAFHHREGPVGGGHLSAGHQAARATAAGLPRLHRPQVRRPPRSAPSRHTDVSLPGQEARLRQHVLSRPQT